MQRIRRAPLRLLAKPLPRSGDIPKSMPTSRHKPDLPAITPDYGALSVKVMASLLNYGSERGRLAAAKFFLNPGYDKWRQARNEKALRLDVPIIRVIYVTNPPPLGPGDYDTRVVEPDAEVIEGEAPVKRKRPGFGVY